MANTLEVKVPDIGDAADVDVIELLVNVGDNVEPEDALITLETDKATMEVPSSDAGIVKEINVAVGDKVSEGSVILILEVSDKKASSDAGAEVKAFSEESPGNSNSAPSNSGSETAVAAKVIDVLVPDIGDASDVDVIEVLISSGDALDKDASLIVLETDKATMEVPAPEVGKVIEVVTSLGDKVSEGALICRMEVSVADENKSPKIQSSASSQPANSDIPAATVPVSTPAPSGSKGLPVPDYPSQQTTKSKGLVHASPAVRRFARELGADLSRVTGSGPKQRVLKEDVQNFVKYELSRPKATAATGSFATPEMPEIDFSKWGDIEEQPLSRIQKISSVNLHRNWITIPHVTQHEEADITELEAFRKSMKEEAAKSGVRLTPLAFVMKAVVHSLQAFPRFNGSLANDGENLILKRYYHIGVAADTPDGLVVPVIKNVDKKSVYEIANELAEKSALAREKKLPMEDMQGSSFTISSLGGIGGTSFTPIVAWPNVAILGLSKNQFKPVWSGSEFVPRLMLPMSLSYDHRVIDGADAARFTVHLGQTLSDIRRILL